MGIKFYDSNGKYWGEYDETRNLFIPSEEPITKTETQNSNLTFENRTMLAKALVGQTDCEACELDGKADVCKICRTSNYEPQTDCGWK